MHGSLPFQTGPDGVRVAVRLTPKGGRDAVDGLTRHADGRTALKARVAAAPEKGAANGALIALLARTWDLPKSSLEVVSGTTARTKTIRIAGQAAVLLPRLEAWARMHLSEEVGA